MGTPGSWGDSGTGKLPLHGTPSILVLHFPSACTHIHPFHTIFNTSYTLVCVCAHVQHPSSTAQPWLQPKGLIIWLNVYAFAHMSHPHLHLQMCPKMAPQMSWQCPWPHLQQKGCWQHGPMCRQDWCVSVCSFHTNKPSSVTLENCPFASECGLDTMHCMLSLCLSAHIQNPCILVVNCWWLHLFGLPFHMLICICASPDHGSNQRVWLHGSMCVHLLTWAIPICTQKWPLVPTNSAETQTWRGGGGSLMQPQNGSPCAWSAFECT